MMEALPRKNRVLLGWLLGVALFLAIFTVVYVAFLK
jgi:hypothetical protein